MTTPHGRHEEHELHGPPDHDLASAFQLHDITPFPAFLLWSPFRRRQGAAAGGNKALPISQSCGSVGGAIVAAFDEEPAARVEVGAGGDPNPALLRGASAVFVLLLTALGIGCRPACGRNLLWAAADSLEAEPRGGLLDRGKIAA